MRTMWDGLRWMSFLLLTCSLHTLPAEAGRQADPSEVFGRVPLHFEANLGQSDSRVKFLAHGGAYTVFLTSTDTVLVLAEGTGKAGLEERSGRRRRTGAAFRIALLGAKAAPHVSGARELPGK